MNRSGPEDGFLTENSVLRVVNAGADEGELSEFPNYRSFNKMAITPADCVTGKTLTGPSVRLLVFQS